jgi:hypothetical protein
MTYGFSWHPRAFVTAAHGPASAIGTSVQPASKDINDSSKT